MTGGSLPAGWRISQTEPTGSRGYFTQASCRSSMIANDRGTPDLELAEPGQHVEPALLTLAPQGRQDVGHPRHGQDQRDQAAQGDGGQAEEIAAGDLGGRLPRIPACHHLC